jgi:hypothetical protein
MGRASPADQLQHLFDALRRNHRLAIGTGEGHLLEEALLHQFVLHVVGHAEHHRPGRAREQVLGRLVEDAAQVIGALDQPVVAGDAGEHRDLIDAAAFAGTLLQPPLPEDVGGRLARDGDHRQIVAVGSGDAGHKVGGAGPGRGDAGAHLTGRTGIAAGQ